MPTDILDCYDSDLDRFADLAGDFDVLAGEESDTWTIQQWTLLADAGGWRSELDRAVDKVAQTQLGLVLLESAALGAFSKFIKTEREEPARRDRAMSRSRVLVGICEQHAGHLWRVEANAASLPSSACYKRPGRKPGALGFVLAGEEADDNDSKATVVPHRAFMADSGPSYFWDPAPSSMVLSLGCGWTTPLRLSLGTFPWVYGNRLQSAAPGLSWRSSSTQHPAPVAIRMAAGFWHAEGNLQADARDVVAAWKHWRTTTAPLVSGLADTPGALGDVYRDGDRLVAHQANAEVAGINGPRGFICVAAYNFIQERFAAFFAMRRALLRARKGLSPELRGLMIANPDPCIRDQLGIGVLKLA